MSSPQPGRFPFPESYSAQDRFLATKTEEAIQDGLQLEAWMRRQHAAMLDFPLALKKVYKLPNKAFGYFGSLDLNGKPTPLMGCRQEIDFGKAAGAGDAGEMLRTFVPSEFLKRAHWRYPDGFPGGFMIEQSLYRTSAGEYGKFAGECRDGCIDWRARRWSLPLVDFNCACAHNW